MPLSNLLCRFHLVALLTLGLLVGCQSMPPSGLSAEQLAMLQSSGFTPVEDGWGLDLSGKILFNFAEEEISSDSLSYIKQLTHTLLSVSLNKVRIDGHTDNIGDPEFNRQLSKRRAEAVAAAMIESGMTTDSVSIRGLGDSKPVADNSTRSGRSENRRVSIVITTP